MYSKKHRGKKGEHGISQVYQKEFLHRDKNNHKVLSVWEKGQDLTGYEFVKSFTKLVDQFDIFGIEGVDQRIFDEINDVLDNEYPKLVNELNQTGSLSNENRALAREVMANFLNRTPRFRTYVWGLYVDPATKDKLLDEIAVFGAENTGTAIRMVDTFPEGDRQNYLMLFVMRHVSKLLEHFQCVILEDHGNRGWATSDNPVVLEHNGRFDAIIPAEAEIYFPLTKKYCFYLHCPLSDIKKGELRAHFDGAVVTTSGGLHDNIMLKIAANATRYVIFPWDMGKVDLRQLTGNKLVFKIYWWKTVGLFRRLFGVAPHRYF